MTTTTPKLACETCPFGTPVEDNRTLCHQLYIVAASSAGNDPRPNTYHNDFWCSAHPAAPRVVTVRRATQYTERETPSGTYEADLVLQWEEWTEIREAAQ